MSDRGEENDELFAIGRFADIAELLRDEFRAADIDASIRLTSSTEWLGNNQTPIGHITIATNIDTDVREVAAVVKRLGGPREVSPGRYVLDEVLRDSSGRGRRIEIRIMLSPYGIDTDEVGHDDRGGRPNMERKRLGARLEHFKDLVATDLRKRGHAFGIRLGGLRELRSNILPPEWGESGFRDLEFVFDLELEVESGRRRLEEAIEVVEQFGSSRISRVSHPSGHTTVDVFLDLSEFLGRQIGCHARVVPLELSERQVEITNSERKKEIEAARESAAVQISVAKRGAPRFETARGRLRYHEAPSRDGITERKKEVRDRYTELSTLSDLRGNEQPQARAVVARYGAALKAHRRNAGAYRLLLAGIAIEAFVRLKAHAPSDPDRNPPLDAEMLLAIDSLMVAHAGLMAVSPDTEATTRELDAYRQHAESLDALHNRVLDPALELIGQTPNLLDAPTAKLTLEVGEIGQVGNTRESQPTQGEIAVKHRWLRGLMTAIGTRLVNMVKPLGKPTRDALIKEAVSATIKNWDKLTTTMFRLLHEGRDVFMTLAQKLPSAFGWIESLYQWAANWWH